MEVARFRPIETRILQAADLGIEIEATWGTDCSSLATLSGTELHVEAVLFRFYLHLFVRVAGEACGGLLRADNIVLQSEASFYGLVKVGFVTGYLPRIRDFFATSPSAVSSELVGISWSFRVIRFRFSRWVGTVQSIVCVYLGAFVFRTMICLDHGVLW